MKDVSWCSFVLTVGLVFLGVCNCSGTGSGTGVPHSPQETPSDPLLPTANHTILAFKQGAAGNCTSIGFIKAVLHHYGGAKGVFHKYSQTPDGTITVSTRRGAVYSLTPTEIAEGAAKAKLVVGAAPDGDGALMAEANSLFSILGKACAADCNSGKQYCEPAQGRGCADFSSALEFLDGGLKWNAPPHLLDLGYGSDWFSLTGNVVARWWKKKSFLNRSDSCVAATSGHTMFVSRGYVDRWGIPTSISRPFALEITHAYCFADEPEAGETNND